MRFCTCIFTIAPIGSFKNASRPSSYIVRAQVYPLQKKMESFKCNTPRYEWCRNLIETGYFRSTLTGERFNINQKLNCGEKCLIHVFTCNQCRIQHVAQNVDTFHFRRNNCTCNCHKHTKGDSVKQQNLYDDFILEDHIKFVNDPSVIFNDF